MNDSNVFVLLSSDDECDESIGSKKRQKLDIGLHKNLEYPLSSSEDDSVIPSSSVFISSRAKLNSTEKVINKKSANTNTSGHLSSSANLKSCNTERNIEEPTGATQKLKAKNHNKVDKQREKEEKAAQKQREKEEKAAKRRREKEERAMIKAATRQAKLDAKISAQQRMGKFAKEEIAILISPGLFNDEGWKESINKVRETYSSIAEFRGIDEGAVQFICKKHVDGGASSALKALDCDNQDGYNLACHLVIVLTGPDKFLDLLERPDDDDDYPKLEAWMEKKFALWKSQWKRSENPRLMILLPGVTAEVHQRWNNASQKDRKFLITDADISDAIVWLQVAFQVECQLLNSKEEVADFLIKMARAISEKPYSRQVTELECIRKIKPRLENPSEASPAEVANDTWIRMLQQIPKMSSQRADSLAQYYPTFRSLMKAYENTKNENEKRQMVSHLFSEKAQHRKLSEHLYRTMTSLDSKDFLT